MWHVVGAALGASSVMAHLVTSDGNRVLVYTKRRVLMASPLDRYTVSGWQSTKWSANLLRGGKTRGAHLNIQMPRRLA